MRSSWPVLVLVRHGETEWTRTGQHTGRTDISLTDAGRRAALTLGARLAEWRFERVLASPLRRALETARGAGYSDAQLCPELMEWDYGEYEGLTRVQIQARAPEWNLWLHGVPGGESVKDVCARVDALLVRLRESQGPVALFSHGHLLRSLMVRWLGLSLSEGRHFELGTTSVSVLGRHRGQQKLFLWNDRNHLRDASSPPPDETPPN
jgi:probable phosphoglycerate mutase